jgi:hypothetical protein
VSRRSSFRTVSPNPAANLADATAAILAVHIISNETDNESEPCS